MILLSAAAEYRALFRTDIETFVNREAVEACIVRGIFERGPQTGIRYFAFVDPSGGSANSMTLAIGHKDRNSCVIDCVRERKPPFSPEAVVIEFAHLLRSYRINKLTGDRFGGEFVREPFKKFDINYDLSDEPKSALYQFLLPVINSQRVQLLDSPRLFNQFDQSRTSHRCAVERTRSTIHPINTTTSPTPSPVPSMPCSGSVRDSSLAWVNGTDDKDEMMRRRQAMSLQYHLTQGSRTVPMNTEKEHTIMMRIISKSGEERLEPDNYILKDGETYRVPMRFQDGRTGRIRGEVQ